MGCNKAPVFKNKYMLRAKSGVFAVKKCGYICTKERLSATILLQKKINN